MTTGRGGLPLPPPGGARLVVLLVAGAVAAIPSGLALHGLGVSADVTTFLAMGVTAIPPLVYLLVSPSMRCHEKTTRAEALRRKGSASLIQFGLVVVGASLLLGWNGASVVLNVTGFYLGLTIIAVGVWARNAAPFEPGPSRQQR